MAGVYTEDTLKKKKKAYFTDLFLKMQDETNSAIDSMMAELEDLNNSSKGLESDAQIIKTVNNNFLKLGY